jgi:hypothetical protein
MCFLLGTEKPIDLLESIQPFPGNEITQKIIYMHWILYKATKFEIKNMCWPKKVLFYVHILFEAYFAAINI